MAAKARQVSGRSLLLGLTNSIAATNVAPAIVAKTWTSISSGNTAGITSMVTGGAQAAAVRVADRGRRPRQRR